MKILWLDINSSYSHSSLALPAIHAQVADMEDWEWCVVSGTINDNPGSLAATVAEENPDVIAATFWLFTHRMQIEVLSRVVRLLENVKIICGGPEFLGDNELFLRHHPFVTAVIRGEGEEALPKFLDNIGNLSKWSDIQGLCWIYNDTYRDNGTAKVSDFASLKYPENSTFFKWDKPFVQLETTRGCFNTCAFCVSGGEKPVRYQSLEQVRERLENIYTHGIRDVRVLDRTFNYDIERASCMLDLFEKYAGKMRFHLEIHPSLLSDRLRQRLAQLPKGLLHLEAGIQSLDSKVLVKSGRKGSLESSLNGLKYLCSLDNVETHADLIAGLPGYSLEMLCNDISTLMETGVDELQIELLKVLPGTQIRLQADINGLKYSPVPPYEVLLTPTMSASDLRKAMHISRTVDLYYNCEAWQKVFRELITDDDSFLIDFTEHLKNQMILDSPVSLERRGVILFEYSKEHYPEKVDEISIAWIKAGFSLKKEPAGNVIKIKHLESFIEDSCLHMTTVYGYPSDTHRFYMFTSKDRQMIFGYDSQTHLSAPVFCATLS